MLTFADESLVTPAEQAAMKAVAARKILNRARTLTGVSGLIRTLIQDLAASVEAFEDLSSRKRSPAEIFPVLAGLPRDHALSEARRMAGQAIADDARDLVRVAARH